MSTSSTPTATHLSGTDRSKSTDIAQYYLRQSAQKSECDCTKTMQLIAEPMP